MRGVYYSACSLCYKTIARFHQKCLLMRDCLLFRRLLLPESTVITLFCYFQSISEVSSFTLELELNQELASIIKDDLAQGPIINL